MPASAPHPFRTPTDSPSRHRTLALAGIVVAGLLVGLPGGASRAAAKTISHRPKTLAAAQPPSSTPLPPTYWTVVELRGSVTGTRTRGTPPFRLSACDAVASGLFLHIPDGGRVVLKSGEERLELDTDMLVPEAPGKGAACSKPGAPTREEAATASVPAPSRPKQPAGGSRTRDIPSTRPAAAALAAPAAALDTWNVVLSEADSEVAGAAASTDLQPFVIASHTPAPGEGEIESRGLTDNNPNAAPGTEGAPLPLDAVRKFAFRLAPLPTASSGAAADPLQSRNLTEPGTGTAPAADIRAEIVSPVSGSNVLAAPTHVRLVSTAPIQPLALILSDAKKTELLRLPLEAQEGESFSWRFPELAAYSTPGETLLFEVQWRDSSGREGSTRSKATILGAAKLSELRSSLSELNRILGPAWNSPDGMRSRAAEFILARCYGDAVDILEVYIQSNPTDRAALKVLAHCALQTGQRERARAVLALASAPAR